MSKEQQQSVSHSTSESRFLSEKIIKKKTRYGEQISLFLAAGFRAETVQLHLADVHGRTAWGHRLKRSDMYFVIRYVDSL